MQTETQEYVDTLSPDEVLNVLKTF